MLTRQYIDDHQLVERYLADQLTDGEREQFEDYYLDHPEILRDLQAVAGIKLGAGLLRASGQLQQLTKPQPQSWRLGLAMAASVLALVCGAAYLFRGPAAQPVILAGALNGFTTALPLAATYQVQRTRSDVDAVLTLPSSPQAMRLRLRPIFEQRAASYRIELSELTETDDSSAPLATAGKLPVDADGFITVYVNSQFLRPGSYELTVTDDSNPATPANDFVIEVVAATL